VSGAIFFYFDYRAITVWAVLLGAAVTFMLPLVTLLSAFTALFILAGLMRGILRVTSAAMVAEIRGNQQDVGLAAGVYNAGLDIGGIAGPALAGVLGSAVGLSAMFQVIAVASLAGYFAVALSTRAGRASLRAGLQEPFRRPGEL
jgi:predicted MFS family arabinose efflux permease